jgi:hypothetical protein
VGAARREHTAGETAVVRDAARAWRDEHLRTSWPILVPRLEGETVEDHALRVHAELAEARAHRDRLDDEMDGSGEAIPVISEEQTDAGVRAAVLKNQYNELCEQLRRKHLAGGSDGQARWMVEGYGDPLGLLHG